LSERHFVVIGNGPAGTEAALALREGAPRDRVTMISRSRAGCYYPHRLPDLIAGKVTEEQIVIAPLKAYADREISLRTCQEAVGLDASRREVTLEHHEVIPCDGFVIAVGGKPRMPESMAAYRALLSTLKSLEDARAWIEKLAKIESVLLIGGDLTSLAVTRALLHLGKKVWFVLDGDAFWPLRADVRLLAEVTAELEKKGVEVLAGADIESISRLADGNLEVQAGGWTVEAGMAGAFFGLVPDVAFLARSGLRIDRGILVDEFLSTGFAGVYAAGDCAQVYHPELRDYWVSVGHENARVLGRIAAANLLCHCDRKAAGAENIFEAREIGLNTSWWMDY